jgi:hypothetical protein
MPDLIQRPCEDGYVGPLQADWSSQAVLGAHGGYLEFLEGLDQGETVDNSGRLGVTAVDVSIDPTP